MPVCPYADCYNFPGSSTGLKIIWPNDPTLTWAEVFGDTDCMGPSNITLSRQDNSVVGNYQCIQVGTGHGGPGETNEMGTAGSVRLGRGEKPKNY